MYVICCCCLELPSLKSLWVEYIWMGETEVYSKMLKDCFNIIFEQNELSKEQICEVCITQLRNALHFKQRAMQSQARLQEKVTELPQQVKEENIEKLVDTDSIIKSEDLEEHPQIFADVTVSCPKTRKTFKRKSTIKDRKEISKRKRKILIIPKGKIDNNKQIDVRNISYVKPRQNAGLILENSTIIPFKSNKGYFTCFYCNKQHVAFDDLKAHINQLHEKMNFKTILKSINRPHDRIKADVSDITCRICKKNQHNLENLVTHLTDCHNVKFIDGNPANSILAYELSDGKFRCHICKNDFLFFKTLTNHMNTHSNDYVCDICGRCFLLPERLRAHINMHGGKATKCEICDKLCVSNVSLQSHIRYSHKRLSYMCSICNLTFTTYRLRMRHLEEVHNRAKLNLTCKICSKQYAQPNSLNSHMRYEHLKQIKEPKHSCNICGALFKRPNALRAHALVHSGEKKFECHICHKKYARAKTLTEHLKIHRNDRRWNCGACGQAFVQKCSLKNHIRVHHVDLDYKELIVYKKPAVDSK